MNRALPIATFAVVSACATSGGRAEDLGARTRVPLTPRTQRAFGLSLHIPPTWRAAHASPASPRWLGPEHRVLSLAADPASDEREHAHHFEALRRHAAQSGWTLDDRAPAPRSVELRSHDRSIEIRIPERIVTLRMPTWVTVAREQLYVVSCVYDERLEARAANTCQAAFDSVGPASVARPAQPGARMIVEGALSLLVHERWTDERERGARVLSSSDEGPSKILVTIASSPTSGRSPDVASIRRRFEARGARVSAGAARTLGGLDGVLFDVTQQQTLQAAVRERALFLWHERKSVLVACAFRVEDSTGASECSRVLESVRRDP
jgi:hypothetical protein